MTEQPTEAAAKRREVERSPKRVVRAGVAAAVLVGAVVAVLPLSVHALDGGSSAPLSRRGWLDQEHHPRQMAEAYALVDRWSGVIDAAPAGYVRDLGGLAAGADGRAYAVDTARGQVHVFQDGSWIDVWGRRPGDEPLEEPHGVVVLDDRVYVADTGAHRVRVFDLEGRAVAEWPGVGEPWGLATDGDERLVVTDRAGDRVLLLDLSGRVRTEYADVGLRQPTGVAAWSDGWIAVLDAGNDRVAVWSADGAEQLEIVNSSQLPLVDVAAVGTDGLLLAGLRSLGLYDRAAGVPRGANRAPVPGGFTAVAAQRSVTGTVQLPAWATYDHNYVFGMRRFDASALNVAEQWTRLPGPAGELVSPRRIVAVADGFDVLDAWPRVQRLGLDGTPAGQVHIAPAADVASDGANRFLGDGVSVRRLSGDVVTWTWQAPLTTTWLTGLIHEPATGDLMTLDVRDQALMRLDTATGSSVVTHALATAGYASFTDIEPRGDGTFLAVNRSRSAVEVRGADGGLIARWPVRGVPLRAAAAPGATFVLTREGWVWKLSDGGEAVAWWDAAADALGRRGVPSDVAVAPDGRVLVIDARANEVRVYARDPAATPVPAPAGDGCTFIRDKWAAPDKITLGETVDVTLTVSGSCLEEGQGADIMLVVDRSGSMAGGKIEAARSAAVEFVGEIDFNVSRVGLVVFNFDADMPVGLTDAPSAVVGSIAGFGSPRGGTDIGEGIELATGELSANGRPGVEHILVVMTDGRPEGDVVDADAAASAAKAAGVRIFTVGFGGDVDPDLLRRVASSPDDYYFAPGAAELGQIYTEIARRITGGVVMRTAVITDVVPSNMLLVERSVVPPPVSFDGRVIRWEFEDVRDDLVLTYELEPLETGVWPTNDEAWFDYTDGLDVPGRLPFPVPEVEVVAPTAVYLPYASRNACRPTIRHADVVLVVDTSSSMAGDKLAAAKEAAELFVDRLALPEDQGAVVAFNAQPALAQGLTGDRGALRQAVRGLDWSPGTVIDAALHAATAELSSGRHAADNKRVTVLLTDGRNNAGPMPVLRAAEAAAASGITIYTIALGSHADVDLLRQVAGDPARAFVAVTPDDLDKIYQDIVGALPCVP